MRHHRGLLAAVLAVAVHGCATSSQAPTLPRVEKTATVSGIARVQAIDHRSREVTLVGEDGQPFSFRAGDQVRNLDQVKVGDTVKVQYTESLVITVKRNDGSAPVASTGAGVTRAAPGESPGGAASVVTTVSARIVAIDRNTFRVTVVNPEGRQRSFQVQDPRNLENVQVGDMVYATYTESVGVSVEPIAPAAK